MPAPTFTEIEAGYAFAPTEQSYTQDDIDRYALASLDMNPVHTNEEWASRARVFGMPETVGHGMMTMSALASVVTREWGVATRDSGVRFVDAKFTKPVKVGETVTITAKVKRKHYHGPGRNWVQIAVEAKDSSADLVGLADVGYNLPD
jgi:phosphate acetyltransferase